MNHEPGDLFCRKYGNTAADEFEHLPDRYPEWYKSSYMATQAYSLQRLKDYDTTKDQIDRFINFKCQLVFANRTLSKLCFPAFVWHLLRKEAIVYSGVNLSAGEKLASKFLIR